MLDGDAFLNIAKKPRFYTETVKAKGKEIVKPYKRTIKKFAAVMACNQGINKKGLIDKKFLLKLF